MAKECILLDNILNEIEDEHVVQVVTNSVSNLVIARRNVNGKENQIILVSLYSSLS